MRFDIRNYFKTGKTPYTAQFSEDFSTENFDGSVIREPVTGSFQAVPTADGVVMQLTIAAETDAECARCLTPIHQSYNFSVDYFVKERELDDPDFELPLDEKAAWIYGSSCTRNCFQNSAGTFMQPRLSRSMPHLWQKEGGRM